MLNKSCIIRIVGLRCGVVLSKPTRAAMQVAVIEMDRKNGGVALNGGTANGGGVAIGPK